MNGDRGLPVDIEARRRAAGDLDSSLCLEAGAGTGKTTLLVERFISILRSGRAACRQIAAITFTEKAAAEMKSRLRLEVGSLLSRGDMAEEERKRLEAAEAELERSSISTIHAFAATILREYPLEAGIDPGFEQLDGIDSSILLDECFNDYLAGEGGRAGSGLRDFLRAGGTVDGLREIALKWYGARVGKALSGIFRGDAVEARGEGERWEEPSALGDRLLERVAGLRAMAATDCGNPEDKGYLELERFARDLSSAGDLAGEELEDLLLGIKRPYHRVGSRSNWDPPESCAAWREEALRITGELERFRAAWMDRMAAGLEEWCEGFARNVDGRKRERGALDFDDLLIRARTLLEDPGVLEALREQYRFVLVDEFQDTDRLQAEIVMLLTGSGSGDDLEIEPGKLFVVGDPKQSIYRFRGAEVEVYEQVREILARSDSWIRISQNFRSVPGIVEWVNGAFSSLIERSGEELYSPSYEPIHAMRDGVGPAVTVMDLETDEEKTEGMRREEGRAVARFARGLVESGREVRDPRTKLMRPVRWGDIALLYRNTTGIEHYEDPLRDEEIPYLVEGGRLYFRRQEVRDISSALWVVEDPFDSMALLAVLRSPLFGFSDEEIFLFVDSGGRLDYIDPRVPPEGGFEDLASAMSILASLHRERNASGPVGVLRSLLEATGYLSLSKLRVHGEQRVRNVRKAMAKARLFEERGRSFRYFARWMRDQDILGGAEGESPMIDEEEDAVRLMTIHKSKGLQFPVVVLVNLVQRPQNRDSSFVRGGRELSLRLSSGLETSDFAAVREEERRRNEAETARLLYVAATRAGDMLVIPAAPEPRGLYLLVEPFLEGEGIVREAVSSLPELERAGTPVSRVAITGAEGARAAAVARDRWREERMELIEKASAIPARLTPSGMEIPLELPARDGAREVPGALAFGSAFHRLMERAAIPGREYGLEELAASAAEEAGIPGGAEELEALAADFLGSDLMGEIRRADRVLTEVPVFISRAPADGPEVSVSGRIDLLFESGGAWTVVDFKTDDAEGERIDRLMEAYRIQGAAYAWALEDLGVSVGRVIFAFVRPGETRTIVPGDALFEEIEKRIRSASPLPSRP